MNHGRHSQLVGIQAVGDTPPEGIHLASAGTLHVEDARQEADTVELRQMRLVGQGNRAIPPEEGIHRGRKPGSVGEDANPDLACLLSWVPVWIR
jgi:hypothetical protein